MDFQSIVVESCILLDLFTNDENWVDWSENTLDIRVSYEISVKKAPVTARDSV